MNNIGRKKYSILDTQQLLNFQVWTVTIPELFLKFPLPFFLTYQLHIHKLKMVLLEIMLVETVLVGNSLHDKFC